MKIYESEMKKYSTRQTTRLGVPIVCQLCGTTRIIADYAGLPHHEPPIKVDSFALAGFRGTPWDYRKMTLNQRVAGSSPARLTIIFKRESGRLQDLPPFLCPSVKVSRATLICGGLWLARVFGISVLCALARNDFAQTRQEIRNRRRKESAEHVTQDSRSANQAGSRRRLSRHR
jgi:hypothetical protein